MSDHGSITLGAHRLRLADQATFEMRGTFIVESTTVRVIPAWRVKRDQLAAQMTTERPKLLRMNR